MVLKKSNFEQVPLEVVKQIAQEEAPLLDNWDDKEEKSVKETRTPSVRTDNWRDLAEAIVVEKDPVRIGELAEKLNEVLALRDDAKKYPVAVRPAASFDARQ
jgi:hypothetical protein